MCAWNLRSSRELRDVWCGSDTGRRGSTPRCLHRTSQPVNIDRYPISNQNAYFIHDYTYGEELNHNGMCAVDSDCRSDAHFDCDRKVIGIAFVISEWPVASRRIVETHMTRVDADERETSGVGLAHKRAARWHKLRRPVVRPGAFHTIFYGEFSERCTGTISCSCTLKLLKGCRKHLPIRPDRKTTTCGPLPIRVYFNAVRVFIPIRPVWTENFLVLVKL